MAFLNFAEKWIVTDPQQLTCQERQNRLNKCTGNCRTSSL